MLEQLEWVRIDPARVVDAGAGTGGAREELLMRFPQARILSLDVSLRMLRAGAGERICGDMQQMPLPDGCAQLLFSNLALHWCPSIGAALAEFRRVLDAPGLVFFSMFGPDTLRQVPVPVVPMALRGLWGSLFSHQGEGAFRGGLKWLRAPVELLVGKPMAPQGITTDQLFEEVARLRGAGVPFMLEPQEIESEFGRRRIVFFVAPDGVRTEIMQIITDTGIA
jgi:SAM-dependent methyltransferase